MSVVSVLPPQDMQRVVDTLIGVICEEMGFTLQRTAPLVDAASTEPGAVVDDRWYYIQAEPPSQSQTSDVASELPPNLVLTSENSGLGTDKFQQYSALGVPEIWRIGGQTLHFYQLEAGAYVESDRSTAFPSVPVAEIPLFVEKAQKVGEQTIAKAFRAWSRMRIRENQGQSNPPPPLPPLNPLL